MAYWKILLLFLGILATLYLLVCITLYFWQNRLIFVPSKQVQVFPHQFDLPHEDVWIQVNSTQKLHSWWIPAPQAKGVILYFHGNGINVGANVEHANRFWKMGFSVLLIDYRGYGRSEGKFPTEKRVYEDAEMALQYLVQQQGIQLRDIFLYGHSLGGAIAINLASHHPNLAGVIVESSFTSMSDMVVYLKRYNWLPINLILHHKFESIEKVKELKHPLLFIHGTGDRVVPSFMSQMLYDAATSPKKQILIVPDARHDNVATVTGQRYQQTIENFYTITRKEEMSLELQ
jgi:alpha-beta hydrolase superfamily lysophospholipase